MLCDHSFRWMDEVVMRTPRFILIALGMVPAVAGFPAGNPRVDFVSKAFRDGSFIPHVYSERDVLRRYGDGERVVDAAGLIRRRYLDPTTRLEVLITSNPDVAPEFRTIDEIRVSSISAGQPAAGRTESLRGVKLKGVAMGDPASKAASAAGEYGQRDTEQATLGSFKVERTCGFSQGGSSICFYVRDGKVVAMALGFGP
ncbi:hypothetical protein A7X87_15910 [Stenotrophomonas maltophilia]|nr:hypothetical protein A7X87_15910 [Stenotrophomonas maltophilia]